MLGWNPSSAIRRNRPKNTEKFLAHGYVLEAVLKYYLRGEDAFIVSKFRSQERLTSGNLMEEILLIEQIMSQAVGSTVNVPLPQGTDLQEYLKALDRKVLKPLKAFRPTALVLSAGLDTFEGDPIGDFTLKTADFYPLGERFGRLGLPTVVLQEGATARRP